MFRSLIQKEKKIAVIGLGYVGLPLALSLAKKFKVVGFDINEARVAKMKAHIDPSKELDSSEFIGRDILFTSNHDDLKTANFFIVARPYSCNQSITYSWESVEERGLCGL